MRTEGPELTTDVCRDRTGSPAFTSSYLPLSTTLTFSGTISSGPRKPSLVSGPILPLPYQLLSPGPSPVWNFMVTVGGLPWPTTR